MEELRPQHERTSGTGRTGLATTTTARDLGTDETDETDLAYDINNEKGDDDVPVTREGHTVPSGEYHHGMEQRDKTKGYPPNIGEQMSPLTYSHSDTESGSGHEESEIFPPPLRKSGETRGGWRPKPRDTTHT